MSVQTLINPWAVPTLEEFLFYCCPECDVKVKANDQFLDHALKVHKLAQSVWSGHKEDQMLTIENIKESEASDNLKQIYSDNHNLVIEIETLEEDPNSISCAECEMKFVNNVDYKSHYYLNHTKRKISSELEQSAKKRVKRTKERKEIILKLDIPRKDNAIDPTSSISEVENIEVKNESIDLNDEFDNVNDEVKDLNDTSDPLDTSIIDIKIDFNQEEEQKTDKPKKCPFCNLYYDPSLTKNHLKSCNVTSKSKPLDESICELCHKSFTCSYAQHVKECNMVNNLITKVEKKRAIKRIKDKKYLWEGKPHDGKTCIKCSKVVHPASIAKHQRECQGTNDYLAKKFPCDKCDYRGATEQYLNGHISRCHPKNSKQCKRCLEFIPGSLYKAHMIDCVSIGQVSHQQ